MTVLVSVRGDKMIDLVSVKRIKWQTLSLRRGYDDRPCKCEGDKITDLDRVKDIQWQTLSDYAWLKETRRQTASEWRTYNDRPCQDDIPGRVEGVKITDLIVVMVTDRQTLHVCRIHDGKPCKSKGDKMTDLVGVKGWTVTGRQDGLDILNQRSFPVSAGRTGKRKGGLDI